MMNRQGGSNHRHDKGRGMIRERAREQFVREHKEMDHEMIRNRDMVMKLINDGFEYLETERSDNRFDVAFINHRTHQTRHCYFDFEANYTAMMDLWRERH